MTKQFNIRLPETTIDRINQLAKIYGSQAKAVIAAVEHLHTKEYKMSTDAIRDAMLAGKINADSKIEVLSGPSGGHGFRTGYWKVKIGDTVFEVYSSVPHSLSLDEQHKTIREKIRRFMSHAYEKTADGHYRYTSQSRLAE